MNKDKMLEGFINQLEKPDAAEIKEHVYDINLNKEDYLSIMILCNQWHDMLEYKHTTVPKEINDANIPFLLEELEVRYKTLINTYAEINKGVYTKERSDELELNAALSFAITAAFTTRVFDFKTRDAADYSAPMNRRQSIDWHLKEIGVVLERYPHAIGEASYGLLCKLNERFNIIEAIHAKMECNMQTFPLVTDIPDIEAELLFLEEATRFSNISYVEVDDAYIFLYHKNDLTGETYPEGRILDLSAFFVLDVKEFLV